MLWVVVLRVGGARYAFGCTLGMLALGWVQPWQPVQQWLYGGGRRVGLFWKHRWEVIDFDPTAFTPALDCDGDSVYHFTTITQFP